MGGPFKKPKCFIFLNIKIPVHAYKSVLYQDIKLMTLLYQLSIKKYKRVMNHKTPISKRY